MKVILLTKGFVAVVSKEDFRQLSKYKWHVHQSRGSKRKIGQPYARTNIDGKKVLMHRFIMGVSVDLHVDHRNHCTLDNRRENLEVIDHVENLKRRRKPKK